VRKHARYLAQEEAKKVGTCIKIERVPPICSKNKKLWANMAQ
jgi:hypothetical protein